MLNQTTSQARNTAAWFQKEAPPQDAEAVEHLSEKLRIKNRSSSRISRYLSDLKRLEKYTDKPLIEHSKEDLTELVLDINEDRLTRYDNQPYSPESKSELRKTIKKFYSITSELDTDWISTHVPVEEQNTLKPEDVPRREDVELLIYGATNARDKAIIALTYIGLLRPMSELPAIRWKDLTLPENDNIGNLHVPRGKTGPRTLPLFGVPPEGREPKTGKVSGINLIEPIKHWREETVSDQPEDLVLSKLDGGNLSHRTVWEIFRRSAKNADHKFTCKTSPKWMRKGRATYLGSDLPPSYRFDIFQIKSMGGWRKLETVRKYVEARQEGITKAARKVVDASTVSA